MKINSIEELINREVEYEDYLGYRVVGRILLVQPDPDRLDPGDVWLYLSNDEEPELNDKVKMIDQEKSIKYYEVRKSSEVEPL